MAAAPQGDVVYGHIAFDSKGRPIVVLPPGEEEPVLSGIENHKITLNSVDCLCEVLKTSFGPRGMDKLIINQDDEITVTNDGATYMKMLESDQPAIQMLVELSRAQDDESGDGTTAVVLLAGALLREAVQLMQRGLRPRTIMDSFDLVTHSILEYLDSIAEDVSHEKTSESFKNNHSLRNAVKTSLSSKVLKVDGDKFSQLAIDAVFSVADINRRDIDFEQIKIINKIGETFDKSFLVQGLIIDKGFSHPQMSSKVCEPRIAVLTCPFEPPKAKTRHKLEIKSAQDYKDLQHYEIEKFNEMIEKVKSSGANLVLCQWGFDDEANHMLYREKLNAVRWVGGPDLELISLATNSHIVPRFSMLDASRLGTCGAVRTISLGGSLSSEESLIFENCPNTKTITVVLYASNKQLSEEIDRSFHDALCVVKNMIKHPKIVYGGASTEFRAAQHIKDLIDQDQRFVSTEQKVCALAYANALTKIGQCLAENAPGQESSLNHVARVQAAIKNCNNSQWIGIDAVGNGHNDMKKANVIENAHQKLQQIRLSSELVRQFIKIDSIRVVNYES